MTNKELQEQLKKYPDSLEIKLDYIGVGKREIWGVMASSCPVTEPRHLEIVAKYPTTADLESEYKNLKFAIELSKIPLGDDA